MEGEEVVARRVARQVAARDAYGAHVRPSFYDGYTGRQSARIAFSPRKAKWREGRPPKC